MPSDNKFNGEDVRLLSAPDKLQDSIDEFRFMRDFSSRSTINSSTWV